MAATPKGFDGGGQPARRNSDDLSSMISPAKLVAGGLREHFTVLEASDTVENPKPAPDMYAAAARALGQRPEDCLALEDSGTGARAARDAGLRLIAIPAPGHLVPPADLALTSLTDPELAAWIATW